MSNRTKFSALQTALKLAEILGDVRDDVSLHCDGDGNGTKGDPRARAYGYMWATASNGFRSLVWIDITAAGILFSHSPSQTRHYILCPHGLTMAQVAAFIVAELDRKNLGVPTGTYIRRASVNAYRPSAIESGSVRVIEDQEPAAREVLLAEWKRSSAAYPLGYAVKVEDGFIAGGYGSI